MSKPRSPSTGERRRQSSGSARIRNASASRSSNSAASKSSSTGFGKKPPSALTMNTRRRQRSPSALSPTHSPSVPRGQRSPQSSTSSGGVSAGFASQSFADHLAVISDMCDVTETDAQTPDLQAMRDDLSRRRTEHEIWRQTFAQRRNHVVCVLERIGERRRKETKVRADAACRKDATTEMDRVVLGSSRRWSSTDENGDPLREMHTT
ncbi:hypothetical protein LSAT2_031503 [Lamellibrachia satsuma]|nr:hypothetical protein LSAT2_031503 [Lamellibrachia satsuma]